MSDTPAIRLKDRLRADMKDALKGKRMEELSLLRGLLAALDNAEAPPISAEARQGMAGPSEIDRLQLDHSQVAAIVGREIQAREQACAEWAKLGRPDEVAMLTRQIALARRYLG
jgi:uncharacterized protein YqeY